MARTVAGTLLLPNGQPMVNARIYFVAKRTEAVSIVEGANASFPTNASGAYSQSIVNGYYSVSIEVPGDSSGTNPRRYLLGDAIIENGAATTLEALLIASNPPSDLPLTLLYQILSDSQAAAASAQASAVAAADSAASISVGTGPTQLPNTTILNSRLGTTGNLGTMAQQNANAIAVSGGAINGASVGATTRSTGAFTSLSTTGDAGFGVAADGSARVQSSNGIKLGNSANANSSVLDWYEEGSFTPTLIGSTAAGTATYSLRSGRYQRVGNTVRGQINLVFSAHTGTGSFIVTGLPFTVSSVASNAIASTYHNFPLGAASRVLQSFISPGGSTINFDATQSDSGNTFTVSIPASGTLLITFSYEVQ